MPNIKKIPFFLLLSLFIFLPFHAFFVTSINGLFFDPFHAPPLFLAAWKEVIILILFGNLIYEYIRKHKLPQFDRIDLLIFSFFLVGLILIPFTFRNIQEIIFGIKYDFFFLFFFLIIKHFSFSPEQRNLVIKSVVASASFVILFGLFSYMLLPEQFFVSLGYHDIASHFTADLPLPYCHYISNTQTCRLQSTLAGPNHLASYLLIIIPLLFSLSIRSNEKQNIFKRVWNFFRKKEAILWETLQKNSVLMLLFFCSIIALYFTYSRAAFIGFFVGILLFLFFVSRSRKHFLQFIGLIFLGGIFSLFFLHMSGSPFIETYIIRKDSSSMHYERSLEGLKVMMEHPFGLGLGRAGPASARMVENYEGFIQENWYMQIAIELGFIGLILFLAIIISILIHLYHIFHKKPYEYLVRVALFIALFSISLCALFLHSWENAPTALTCFGLLGVYWGE